MGIIRRLCLVLMGAFLALSPGWLMENLSRNTYMEWNEKEKPAWQGRIELWHIAEFRTYQGKVMEHLKKRAYAYCKKHYNVHIDVTGLTLSQYEERIARGEFPDAYSFRTGLLYREQLRPFYPDTGRVLENLPIARAEGETYAVPYLMSGYFLAGNTQLMASRGVSLPKEATPEAVRALAGEGLSMPPVLAARAGITGELAAYADFQAGKVMLAVLDARALGDIQRSTGRNMAIDAVPYGEYSDQIFYIGPARNADDGQARALGDFVEHLLGDGEQARLTALGAMPVVREAKEITFAEPLLTAYYGGLSGVVAPEPFSYQRNGAQLAAEAEAAVAGDAFASTSFFERMQVVERGIF